jgi:amino acid transporter
MIETPPPSEREEQRKQQGPSPLAPAPIVSSSVGKRLRQLVFGNPISSEHAEHTLLTKLIALPVFASDAISSVAYATQQIILALGAAGLYAASQRQAYTNYTMLITGLIVALLVIVVLSYWQTIFGYPSGGGSYIVSKDNLGALPGLIAAAALLIDYVLTVSVSIASGVQNLGGIPLPHALAWLHFNNLVPWCLLFIALLTIANLRGLKESGAMFAIFTYGFVGMCYVMIAIGLIGPLFGWTPQMQYVNQAWGPTRAAETFGLVILLRAFAQGCSAMTGTEAVSNGIPAFKEPKSRNAALTLVAMGVILGTIFLGVSFLAMKLHVVYWEGEGSPPNAVIDQISGAIFGKKGVWAIGYYMTQFFTAAILVLAANTSFADFPRLSSILARDRYLPKQLSNLGDKLVFNNGIFILGLFAALLVVVKKGSVDALIPLYAIGVFLAFTLSQSGMVVHWNKLRQPGWKVKAWINGVGAVATFVVLMDIAFEKFLEGAWAVIVLIALLVLMFRAIHGHYLDVAQQLKLANYQTPDTPLKNTVLVLIPALHRGVMPALEYARSLSPDCRAVHICTDPERMPQLRERWEQWGHDVPLVILNSPYRSLISPVMRYLDAVQHERHNHTVTVVVPEFVATRKWHALLHGQSGLRLKLALLSRRDVIVANVRYYLQHSDSPPPADALAEEEMAQQAHGHNGHATSARTDEKAEAPVPLSASAYDANAPVPGSAQALAAVPYNTTNAPDATGTPVQDTGILEDQRAYGEGLNGDSSNPNTPNSNNPNNGTPGGRA